MRFVPRIYRHREIPRLMSDCVNDATLIVSHRGARRNYRPVQAVLELQGLRRIADDEVRCNDPEDGEEAFQLATALLAHLAATPPARS